MLSVIAAATVALGVSLFAQAGRASGQRQPPARQPARSRKTIGEFTFVRTIYQSPMRGWRWVGSWATDFPEADYHFIQGARIWSLTTLDIAEEPLQLGLLDERLCQFPLLYFVEPGYMELSDEEAERLREYTARGGFLFLDDFWGDYEWANVQEQMNKVFPDREIHDLPLDHPLFNCYFNINEVVQIPGIGSWLGRGITHEKGGVVPHYMGIQDAGGRLVAFIARNCDLGDAWEWINDPRYPAKYGLAAYRLSINVITYAMSH